ncbi:Holliday junction resolvase RuvX [Mangrovivirga sp. M17]|uniref:Putative pre-16S rRNA nuclease n=1 Tax=Mangrovivirga halotolerans TaxID=2993936 RepID=A0ABT3RS14_9BACT|nr:Holliday junction resolvase RuvX [Mangrovivirga halotolerans]MCX2744569.1 Holliday junction resolvase RuvX [Mangrovivirga halotolerans]
MPRILAVDYGTKRVGLAVTDPLKIIATGLDTVHSKDVVDYLKDYLSKEDVEAFVVGVPYKEDGSPTNNTQHCKGFITTLKKQFPGIPVHEQDEAFTSVRAMESMIAAGSKKKDRRKKENIDKVSAVLILQEYLESVS